MAKSRESFATMLPSVPRAFRGMRPDEMPRERIALAVANGVPGTAMKSFAGTLAPREIEAVSAFVHDEFVVRNAGNTRYHTPENGWPRHERYAAAYTDYLDEVQRFCVSKQVAYFRADVNTPFDELILRVFRRGGFLR